MAPDVALAEAISDSSGQYTVDIQPTSWLAPAQEDFLVSLQNPEACGSPPQQFLRGFYRLASRPAQFLYNTSAQPHLLIQPASLLLHNAQVVHMGDQLQQQDLTFILPDLQVTDSSGACHSGGQHSKVAGSAQPPAGVATDQVICVETSASRSAVLAFNSLGEDCWSERPCPANHTCAWLSAPRRHAPEWLPQPHVLYPAALPLAWPDASTGAPLPTSLINFKIVCENYLTLSLGTQRCAAIQEVFLPKARVLRTLLRDSAGLGPPMQGVNNTVTHLLALHPVGGCAPLLQF